MTTRSPENSQLAKREGAVGGEVHVVDAATRTETELTSCIEWGSRKSSRLRASATTMAYRPSGVK